MPRDVQITLIGTLTSNPETKFLQNGDAVCNIGLAVNTRKKEGDTWVDGQAHFYDLAVWRDYAKNLASLPKGTRVIVIGTLDHETWEQDGAKRSKHKVNVEAIGPDLRWATAAVTKVTKDGNSSSSGSSSRSIPDEDPFAT